MANKVSGEARELFVPYTLRMPLAAVALIQAGAIKNGVKEGRFLCDVALEGLGLAKKPATARQLTLDDALASAAAPTSSAVPAKPKAKRSAPKKKTVRAKKTARRSKKRKASKS